MMMKMMMVVVMMELGARVCRRNDGD